MKPLSLIEIAFFLKKTSLFKELDLDLLIAISDKINQDNYDAEEKVFDLNQRANRMYFIASGKVDLLDEEEKILSTVHEGDFFGDEALFSDAIRIYSAVSKNNSLLLTLTKTNLHTILSECPSAAIALLERYAKRISP